MYMYWADRAFCRSYLDPLLLGRVRQLGHAPFDVVQPLQQVVRLPAVLVPLGGDGEGLPLAQGTQVLHAARREGRGAE